MTAAAVIAAQPLPRPERMPGTRRDVVARFPIPARVDTRQMLRQQLCAQRDRLFGIALAWCRQRSLAEELVQETLTRALANLDRLKDESRLEGWVTRIMVNLYRDQIRRQKPTAEMLFEPASDIETPEQAADRGDRVHLVRQALRQLSECHRQVIALVYLAEISYVDAAKILDLPVGTVMSRLWRGRQHLRELLERQQVYGTAGA